MSILNSRINHSRAKALIFGIAVCAIALSILSGTTGCTGEIEKLSELSRVDFAYSRGLGQIADSDYRKAIITLSRGLEVKADGGLFAARAFANFKIGRYTESINDSDLALASIEGDNTSIADLNKHLSKIPYESEAFLFANRGLSRIFENKESSEAAIADINHALEIEPDNYLWYCYLAVAQRHVDDFGSAFKSIEQSLDLKERSAIATHILATLYSATDQHERAKNTDRDAVKYGYRAAADPTFPMPHEFD